MSSIKPLAITTPVARLIGGSLYEPREKDFDGQPLVVKNGANKGQPRKEYSFGVAIAKNPGEKHFSQHPFFAPIWAYAHQVFPAGEAQRRDFAWKITDGDSTEPNKRNKRPCDNEGYRGHWVIWFSSGTPPKVWNADGSQLILEKDAVKPGYFVQVFGNVVGNQPSQSPGLFVNHHMVAFSSYGEEISFGPDVSAAGFGKNVTLPPGASATPVGGAIPSTGAPPPPPSAVAPLIPNIAPPPPPVAPPAAVAPPPAAPAYVMTAKAGGATRESFHASGWSDQAMIDAGYMLAPVAAVPAPLPVGSVPPPAPPAPIAVAPPPLPVIPNPAILAVPPAPGAIAPPPPPLPVAPAVRLVEGRPLSEWLAGGWSEALLIQHGKLAA